MKEVYNSAVKILGLIVLMMGINIVNPYEAIAVKSVDSPAVESHEFEMTAASQIDIDRRDDKNNNQVYNYTIGYSFIDHWFTELQGETQKKDDHNLEFTSVEWSNIVQLLEHEKQGLDAGLYFAYETTVEAKSADKIEAKILLGKTLGRFVHTANIIFEKEVGGGSLQQTTGGLAWSSRYFWKDYFEPGVEFYSDFGELHKGLSYTKQSYQCGPVFYGKIGQRVNVEIGYLFGLTDSAPEGEIKLILAFDQHF